MTASSARVGPTAISTLIATLTVGEHTFADLQVATGLPGRAVSAWVAALRAAQVVYVAQWLCDSRGYPTIATFSWGVNTQDAIKPTQTGTERNRSWRQRHKESR